MALQFSVYTCPPIPTAATSPDPSSEDSGFWSPLSCTVIFTPQTAVLVDCPATIAATIDLATWIKSILPNGCVLRYFIATHAHGDHFLGLPTLQETFPSVTAFSTAQVLSGIAEQHSAPVFDGVWRAVFPSSESGTGIPLTKADFGSLPPSNELHFDGKIIKLYDVPHGDTHANSFIHVPELDLVVAGDIVYNGDCHQFLGEASTKEKRKQWIQALHQIEALRPMIVVPGHTFTPMGAPDGGVAQAMLEGTKEYIQGFEEELNKARDEKDLFERVRSRYPRWNLYILSMGCHASIAAK